MSTTDWKAQVYEYKLQGKLQKDIAILMGRSLGSVKTAIAFEKKRRGEYNTCHAPTKYAINDAFVRTLAKTDQIKSVFETNCGGRILVEDIVQPDVMVLNDLKANPNYTVGNKKAFRVDSKLIIDYYAKKKSSFDLVDFDHFERAASYIDNLVKLPSKALCVTYTDIMSATINNEHFAKLAEIYNLESKSNFMPQLARGTIARAMLISGKVLVPLIYTLWQPQGRVWYLVDSKSVREQSVLFWTILSQNLPEDVRGRIYMPSLEMLNQLPKAVKSALISKLGKNFMLPDLSIIK